MSLQVDLFDMQLNLLNKDFICETQLPAASVLLSFLGSFQGQTVLWKMSLGTLAHFREASCVNHTPAQQAEYHCPFIEIAEGIAGVFQLRVGLDIPLIDEPAIKKTIIMIRNYKRLRIGKIEFCAGKD